MGLDITHYKATLIRPEFLDPSTQNYFTADTYTGFDTNIQHFEKCIQLIDTPTTLKTIIFPKDESKLEEVNQFLKGHDYIFHFQKNLNDIDKTISAYQQKYSLTKSLIHKWTTSDWIGIHLYLLDKKPGFYYEEIGYQRKGMNENLWTRFDLGNAYCYTKKEDFEFAYSCIDYSWSSDTALEVKERKQLFKENFVEKFENNKSWMEISN